MYLVIEFITLKDNSMFSLPVYKPTTTYEGRYMTFLYTGSKPLSLGIILQSHFCHYQ